MQTGKGSYFCFGHGVGAHVCGIAGISDEKLKEMNSAAKESTMPKVSRGASMDKYVWL